jgi:hypothetical protein
MAGDDTNLFHGKYYDSTTPSTDAVSKTPRLATAGPTDCSPTNFNPAVPQKVDFLREVLLPYGAVDLIYAA